MEWQIIGYAITAFSGAVFALVLTEVLKWLKRPKLSMNLDFSALTEFRDQNTGDIQKEIRLSISNMGKTPATYCEAKIEPLNANNKSLFDPSILHWVRRFLEPKIGPENTFSPITINAKDHEFLAMLILINDNGTNIPRISLKSASHRPYNFAANTRYKIKVTVFSSNHGPVSKNFSLLWNGKWDGFNTDVIKVVSD